MVKCHRDHIETNFRLNQNDYIINSHGSTTYNPSYPKETFDPLRSEIQYLKLPSNIEIHMYTNMFDFLTTMNNDNNSMNYSICQIIDPKIKQQEKRLPYHVFKNCFFPNLYFSSDTSSIFKYSGILHCQSNCVIYNMDAKIRNKKCSIKHIKPSRKDSKYQYNPEKNNYIPNPQNWEQCGPINLADALQVIVKFNQQTLHNFQPIKIHISACSGGYSVNFRDLESISTNDLNYKKLLKIVTGQGNKLDTKQFIQQLLDKKKTHPLKLYWKKKMPADFKQIYDKKPKGKIYQYYLNPESQYYIQFIFRPDYSDWNCINFLILLKKVLNQNNLYQQFTTLNSNVTIDFSAQKYYLLTSDKLTELDKTFYHSEKDFNQAQFDKVYDLMRETMVSKIERLLQKVSKITQKKQTKVEPQKSKTIKKIVSK